MYFVVFLVLYTLANRCIAAHDPFCFKFLAPSYVALHRGSATERKTLRRVLSTSTLPRSHYLLRTSPHRAPSPLFLCPCLNRSLSLAHLTYAINIPPYTMHLILYLYTAHEVSKFSVEERGSRPQQARTLIIFSRPSTGCLLGLLINAPACLHFSRTIRR